MPPIPSLASGQGGSLIPPPARLPQPVSPAQASTAPPAVAAPVQQSPLDPTIVNLAKAIRQTETRGQKDPFTAKGASGEYGAYQYMPNTWAGDSKKYLGSAVPLTSATPEQQNEVAYKKIADLKAAGNNVGQIASIWNSGSPDWQGKVGVNSKGVKYDVPQYVNSVAQAYQAFKAGQTPTNPDTASTVGNEQVLSASQQADAANAAQSGALFPSATGDSNVTAGLKTAGNLAPSAFNFAKGVLQALNPVNTVKNLAAIPGAFNSLAQQSGGVIPALEAAAKELPSTAYHMLVPEGIRADVSSLGGFAKNPDQILPTLENMIPGVSVPTRNVPEIDQPLQQAQRDVVNDPVGTIAPLIFAADGGVKALDASGITTDAAATLDKGISMAAKPITAPVGYAFGKAADITAGTAKYATAKATGLNADTISQISKTPDAFTPEAMANTSRASLGETVGNALNDRIDNVSEAGAGYGDIKKNATPVTVDPNFLKGTIEDATGLKLKKGTFTADAKAAVDSPSDIAKIQRLYDAWQPYFKKGTITSDDFLTLRGKLAKIANFDTGIGKSAPLESAAARIRGSLNTEYRDQITGLSEKDADFSSQAQELATLRKGFIDKNGNLTDAAVNRIANAAGKGKDAVLSRLEQISPGITLKIRQLKAVEDIQNIHKVGTYVKSTIEGGGLIGGIATANIPLIAASVAALLLTQPEVAVRVLRGYGKYAAPIAQSVMQTLKKGGNAINNLPNAGAVKVGAFSQKTPALTQ